MIALAQWLSINGSPRRNCDDLCEVFHMPLTSVASRAQPLSVSYASSARHPRPLRFMRLHIKVAIFIQILGPPLMAWDGVCPALTNAGPFEKTSGWESFIGRGIQQAVAGHMTIQSY